MADEIGDRHLVRMCLLKWKCTNECRLLTSGEMEAVLGKIIHYTPPAKHGQGASVGSVGVGEIVTTLYTSKKLKSSLS